MKGFKKNSVLGGKSQLLNVDCDYKRVNLCNTTHLFRFPHPLFWNRYKRGSDAHYKWQLFFEFEKHTQGQDSATFKIRI